jgi:hypothetical protein
MDIFHRITDNQSYHHLSKQRQQQWNGILQIQAQRGSSTHWLQLKDLQPGNVSKGINTLNNIIHHYIPPSPVKQKRKRKQVHKFVEGYFYKQSEDDFVDVYAQQL